MNTNNEYKAKQTAGNNITYYETYYEAKQIDGKKTNVLQS